MSPSASGDVLAHLNEGTTRRELLKRAGGASLALALAGYGSGSAFAGGGPTRGGRLRVAITGAPTSLDPALTLGTGGYVIRSTYQALVRITADLYKLAPALATSWVTPDRGKTWVFQLRKGVTFHNGAPFTADDVIFTFARLKDAKVASPSRVLFQNIRQITKNGDHTVRFELARPSADFPSQTGGYHGGIVSHTTDPATLANQVNGTGPFRLASLSPASGFTLERYENYYESGLPYLDAMEWLIIPDNSTRVNSLKAGEIHFVPELPIDLVPSLQNASNADVSLSLPAAQSVAYMRSDKGAFADPRVREALKLSLDRAALTKIATRGIGTVADDNPVPRFHPYYVRLPRRKRNIPQAKALLAEAGHSNGVDVTMHVPVGGPTPGFMQLAEGIQAQAKEAGIRVKVKVTPTDVFWSKYWLTTEFGIDGWAGRSTMDEQLRLAYYSGAAWNESHMRNRKFDTLLDQARSTTDEKRRKAIYADIQRVFQSEGGSVILHHLPNASALSPNMKGYREHPMGLWADMTRVWLAS